METLKIFKLKYCIFKICVATKNVKERALRVLEHTELNIVFETEQRKIHLSKTKEKWIFMTGKLSNLDDLLTFLKILSRIL